MNPEEKRRLEKHSAEMLLLSGRQYAERVGPEAMKNEIHMLRATITAWNQINGSSISYSLPMVEAMMLIISAFPFTSGLTQVAASREYTDFYGKIAAIRFQLITERDERIKKANPDLSTPGAEKMV